MDFFHLLILLAEEHKMEPFFYIFLAGVAWYAFSTISNKTSDYKKSQEENVKCRSQIYDLKRLLGKKTKKLTELSNKVENLDKCIKEKDQLFAKITQNNNSSLDYISALISDHLTLQYDLSAKFLETKKRPAFVEAKRIKELKKETRETIKSHKIMEYKYQYLLQLFPDLELYIDDIETINELTKLDSIDDITKLTDKTRYYLSKEEYQSLSENDRNQLALENYIKNRKSKWQIGRDYELFIGHEYSKKDWSVNYFGIDKQLNDMGRDLITKKDNTVHIIQCKYWSRKKMIHEKHIAQLYGTAIQYLLSSSSRKKVVPVFATNITLSSTAKSFAKYLDVHVIENREMGVFPRIKCNIGRDEYGNKAKIYHLPMDQQYDKTKICNQGDFFAYTVEEAVNNGFRRAWKWYGNG